MVKLPTQAAPVTTNTDGNKSGKTFATIPNNTMLNVVVEKCEVRPLKEWFREKYNVSDTHEVSFMFRVVDENFKRRVLFGNAKPYINDSDNCRLRIWTEEIMGVNSLPDGYEFDTDDLVGLNARILVGEYTKNDGTTDNKVKEVLRAVDQTASTSFDEEPF